MTLKEWFAESEDNIQAIYDGRNGKRYLYKRGKKLSKFAQNLVIEQEVYLINEMKGKKGAWLIR